MQQGSPAPFKEETIWRGRPSWTLLAGRIALIIVTLAIIPILYFLSRGGDFEEGTTGLPPIALWVAFIALVIEAVWLLIGLIQLRSTLYTITNQRLMIESGLLSKSLSEIDLRYVDDTQFTQSLFDRLLGIGNVMIISSDKSTPTTVLRSIRDPRGVRETLRTHAYQVSQRQIFTRAT